ncbi:MAG: acetylornithine/succinylornithine family transaminase [Gammaproteobacteria bacterium]|nr:acetylornithine/succinylornithine family transaminase [Gammaproteobacteria bacterium]
MQTSITPALMSITHRPESIMVRGEGSWLWDNQGKRYLDFIQGWAVNALGHCPAEISQALERQSRQLITPSPALHNGPQHELAERLIQLSGMNQVHFANSGGEANEAAIKLARKWAQKNKPGATEIITTINGFHGRTLAMMAASGKAGWDELFPPVVPGFRKVSFGDVQAVIEAIDEKTAAIMVEPIQGEAGVIVPPEGYLQQLREITCQHNMLLIADEVQTGIGRTGENFAFEHSNIRPDIVTLGKGLGGGVPLSAVMAVTEACVFEPGDQGGTYNGNPLMCATGLAVVDTVCEAGFLARVRGAGNLLEDRLQQLGREHGFTDVRGRGLLWAVDLPRPVAAQVQEQAMELGLLINAPRANTLRLMPALNVSDQEILQAVDLLEQAIQVTTPG